MGGAFRHASAQSLARVGKRVVHQLALGAARRGQHPHCDAGADAEGFGHQDLAVQAVAEQHETGRRYGVVELCDEGFQDPGRVVVACVAGVVGPVAVVAARTEEEYLNAGLPRRLVGGDDVGGIEAAEVDVLACLDVGQRPDTVAEVGGPFELQCVAGLLHAPGELPLDPPAAADQESACLVDQGAIVLVADASDAGAEHRFI